MIAKRGGRRRPDGSRRSAGVPDIRVWAQAELGARLYPDYVSEGERYLARLGSFVTSSVVLLEAGCGHRRLSTYIARKAKYVIGVDLDDSIRMNQGLSAKVQGRLEQLPLRDNSVDLISCRYVVEHLRDSLMVFREFGRVLRPGGHVVLLTPNAYYYVALLSRLLPQSLHMWCNQRRGRRAEDTFPAYYRANTLGRLRRVVGDAGLRLAGYELFESRPNYLVLSRWAYLAGLTYERLVDACPELAFLRANLLAVLTKPCGGPE